MAIAYVNSGYTDTSPTAVTTIPVAMPASIVVGNLLVMFVNAEGSSGSTYTTPAGWTLVTSFNGQAVFYKVAAAGDVGVTTVSVTATPSHYYGAITQQYSGAATTSPIDGTPINTNISTPSTTWTIPTYTVIANSVRLDCVMPLVSVVTSITGETLDSYTGYIGRTGTLTAGATGTKTVTVNPSDSGYISTFAIKAGAVTGPPFGTNFGISL